MKFRKIPLFSILIAVILISGFFIANVHATNYEKIKNPSFETSTINYIEDSGFESNAFNSGLVYGNWTEIDNMGNYVQFYTITPHSGTYCMFNNYAGSPNNASISYVFNTNYRFNGSDFIDLTFYIKPMDAGDDYRFAWGYTDNTIDAYINVSTASGGWIYQSITTLGYQPNASKIIANFTMDAWNYPAAIAIDDFTLTLNFVSDGQTSILTGITGEYSYPWYAYGLSGWYINNSVALTGNKSASIIGVMAQSSELRQSSFGYLYSNNISSISLYAKTDTSQAKVRVYLHYSDGSQSYEEHTITNSWIQYTFNNAILSGKIVSSIGIYILPITYFSGSDNYAYSYIDVVSMISTQEKSIFDWTLNPEPISRTNSTFIAYQRQSYSFLGYIFDSNGSLTQNGTFIATTQKGTLNGLMTNGYFIFNLAERVGVGTYDENINIQIITGNDSMNFLIVATWDFVSGQPQEQTPNEQKSNEFINAFPIVLIFALFTIPATYYLGIAGFIGGLNVSALVCVWGGLAPTWTIAVLVLIDIVMIYFRVGGERIINRDSSEEE